MPQVNVLPINVSQKIESKDEKSSVDSNTSNDDFSQYIDLHLNKSKEAESSNKVDSANSDAINTKSTTETNSATKESDSPVESNNTNDETGDETPVQKIAASGKKDQTESNPVDQKALTESEQLMSFLTKADNTLINQSANASSNASSPEQFTTEQKAHYEAQLLLKASDLVADLSPVAKAVVSEQVAVEQISTDQAISDEELILSNGAKVTGKEGIEATVVKSPVDSQGDGKNKDNTQAAALVGLVESSDKKAVSPEPDAESKTDVKQTNISSDKTNTAQQQTSQPLSSKSSESLGENDLVSNTDEGTSLTVEQKLTKKAEVDNAQVNNDKTGQETRQKEVNQSSNINAINDKQTAENKAINNNTATQIDTNTATQIDTNNSTKTDSEKSLEKTVERIEKQVSPSKEAKQDKVSNLSEPQLTKSELAQNSEITQKSEAVQSNEVTKANEVVNAKKIVTANNQIASNYDDANKTQIKQDEKVQLATSFAEQSQQKPATQKEGEVLVEDKINASAKRESSVNGTFVDVSGKATQTPQHIMEQQSAEILNPSVATEVTQSQKTNTQLHQETISLFRKDSTEAVKDKVMLMISQKLQQFDITLDPPELGNMQVRVNLQGEQAVVNFMVQSQQTKDALDQNMHKLRELLAEQGVDVGDANVEQQSQQSANEEDSSAGNNSQVKGKLDNIADANDVIAHTLSAKMIDSSTTRVDYYA